MASSNAARHAAHAGRAAIAQSIAAGRTAGSIGIAATREAARITSYSAPEIVLTASDAGDGTATIHVVEHDRVYPVQGSVHVPNVTILAADVLGQALGAPEIFVYYVDPTLADPTPAFLTTTDRIVATNGAQAGLHFVGVTPTPIGGAPPTTGTGGTSPSGWPESAPVDHRYPTP